MGYILYTANGTFNPSSYGLVVGDVIQALLIGGGGIRRLRNRRQQWSGI